MDLDTITVDDFKALFRRDFPYLPEYDGSTLYNAGQRVYYTTTALFYDCTVNGTTGVIPTTTANWDALAFGLDSTDNYVLDEDITKAFAEAKVNLNQALFSTDDNIELGYLYLAAHYLVNDMRAAKSGISGSGAFSVSSRAVGNVSESYAIPEAYTESPILQFYTHSTYGLKYLSLVLPKLSGNVATVCGGTNP